MRAQTRSIRAHALEDVGRRRRVVVAARRAPRAGREDAGIEHPAQHHADALPLGERQESSSAGCSSSE